MRLHLALALLLALFSVDAGASLWAATARADAGNQLANALNPARVEVQRLLGTVADEESAVLDFVLTGDQTYATSYTADQADEAAEVASLRAHLARWPRSLGALDQVELAAQRWRDEAAVPAMAARRGSPGRPASAAVGRSLFSSLHHAIDTLSTRVDAAVASATAGRSRYQDLLTWVIVGSFALAVALIAVLVVQLRRSLTRPLDALVASMAAVAGGDLEHEVAGTGPSELVQLGGAAEQMRARMLIEAADALRHSLVLAQEQERRRIAADIHDDSVQAMTAVSLRLQRLRRHLGGDAPTSMLHDAEQATVAAIGRLRRLIFELHPPTLENEGLTAALRLYLQETFDPLGVRWHLDTALDGEPGRTCQVLAYRLAREAIFNVAKHARCQHMAVAVRRRGGGIHLQVADDGVGFRPAPATAGEPGHLGLGNSSQMAGAAGGWWRVHSREGSGTVVTFWLPDAGLPDGDAAGRRRPDGRRQPTRR